MTASSARHSVQFVRQLLETAIEALPSGPQTLELALMIEEAIEISFELELASGPSRNRGTVVDLLRPAAPRLRR